jgi:type II secretory ATPase GspE/PulE/Tfp pilus assembly ATPase PilB-like protein
MISTLILGQVAAENMPAVPGEGGFFNLAKIIMMAVFLFLWALPAGWCSRDAKRLSLNPFMWGGVVMAGAILGWFFWFSVPMYFVGFLFFVLFGYGSILVYAFYRDSIVEANDKILNPSNLMAAIKGHTETKFEVTEKVRLATTQGREPKIPAEIEGQKLYQCFQDLMFDGLWRRANEILIQPAGEKVNVLFKIDGVMNEYDQWERLWGQGIIDYVKGICKLDLNERRQPQKSKLVAQQVNVGRKVTLDIETAGSTAGEKMHIRIRAEEAKFTIDDIGFTDDQMGKVQKFLTAKQGLILITGMPDAGVTSTMYAIGRSLDAFTQNIHSVEIKPLMDLDNITQNVHQTGTDKNFSKLIQSISRKEPDTILVDPCSDPEVAQMVAQIVAKKGKKVFVTMRASSVFSALGRITRWIEDPAVAGEAIMAILFQRLVRKLCPACREAYKPNQDMLRKMNFSANESVTFYRPPTQQMVDKKGVPIICATCQGSGYVGRTGVFEILLIDEALREAIQSNDPVRIKAQAKKSGLKPWQDVAIEKVVAGVTSVHEVIRVSKEAESLTGKK